MLPKDIYPSNNLFQKVMNDAAKFRSRTEEKEL